MQLILGPAGNDVSQIIIDGNQRIHETQEDMAKLISALDSSVGADLDDLADIVRSAQANAQSANRSIDNCLEEEEQEVRTLNRRNLRLCGISLNLNRLSLKLANIGKLTLVLDSAVVKCTDEDCDYDKIESCVRGVVAEAEAKVEGTKADVSAAILLALDESARCANTTVTILKENIVKITDKFTTCARSCPPHRELVFQLIPLVREAVLEVSNVVDNGTQDILSTRDAIDNMIADLRQQIEEQKCKLNETVKRAISDAHSSGKNISVCLQQEAESMTLLNLGALELCSISNSLNSLSFLLADIGKLKVVLHSAIGNCIKEDCALDKIKSCVERIIANAGQQVAETRKGINASLNAAMDETGRCAKKTASSILEELQEIADTFMECDDNADSYAEIVTAIQPLLTEAKIKISDILNSTGKNVLRIQHSISQLIISLNKQLDLQQEELNDIVKRAQLDAAKYGKGIDACVEEEERAMAQVSRDKLNECGNATEITQRPTRLEDIKRLRLSLNGVLAKCTKRNRNNMNKIRDCAENAIVKIVNTAIQYNNDITNNVMRIQEQSASCAVNETNRLSEEFVEMSQTFSDCVSAA